MILIFNNDVPTMRTLRSLALPLTLGLALAGCTGGAGEGTATATETEGGSSGTSEPTGGSTGVPTEDLNPYTLGEQASQACVDATPKAGEFLAASEAGDAAAASAAYTGALQSYVQALDSAYERSDDAAIVGALAQGDAAGAALAEGHLLSSLAKHMRERMNSLETGAEDKYAAWDEAHCVWQGALKRLAARAESAAWAAPGDPIVADIEAAFAAGHDAIAGEAPATSIDDWRVPPARQIVEKTLFRAVQRDLVHHAGVAPMKEDPVSAARALGALGLVRDRMQDRNTPGIAQIEAMLTGDPALINAQAIAVELDVAFAKRTRGYCDKAFEDGLGIPTSYKGAVEGRTYGKLLAAGMRAAKLDPEPYLADWEEYVALVRAGDDEPAARAVSQRLIDATCSYQAQLGVVACTSDQDEVE